MSESYYRYHVFFCINQRENGQPCCADKGAVLAYSEFKTLRLFITETGKMTPRRISGTCAKHQRKLAVCIKRARHLALLPYAPSHM